MEVNREDEWAESGTGAVAHSYKDGNSTAVFRAAIQSNIEQDLASALKRLQKLVALDQRGQMQELRSPEGAGIMCWFAAAHPDLFLDSTNHSFVVPPYVLRWGVCGRAKFNGFDLVQFDTSVVQNGRDFTGAVTELRLRLGALRWPFDECMSEAKYFRYVELTGRVFVRPEDDVSAGRRELGSSYRDWGFELVAETTKTLHR
ncbi:hypothetical protein JKP88DRAFT_353674 [Tribonema minus]|uniref:Uncharacterized protein n=1 Tax=Tribonema minus TaxID=303371 RepID=A0A835Z606_9STRA|nr:hypothetical protein JKP88DRAFT_353674 [Tribonema minus]